MDTKNKMIAWFLFVLKVAVLSFNSDVKFPAECYSDTLSFATNQNIAKLKEFVSLLLASASSESNFEKGLTSAFSYFETSDNMNDTSRGIYSQWILKLWTK